MTDHGDREFLGLSRPTFGDAELQAIAGVLESGWVTSGPHTERFDAALGDYVGAPGRTICVSSCTGALTLALRLLGVTHGDEVLLPTLTFVACANVVEHAGARPVFVDSDPVTGAVDLDRAADVVGPRTRALVVVHLGGRPLDLGALASFTQRTGVPVVEDAAHAIGAAWDGRRIGSSGNLTAFSFHAGKNITTFEGGALVARDAEEAQRAARLAMHGIDRSAWKRHGSPAPGEYDVTEAGYKLRMHDVAAAVGLVQIARLDEWIERRGQLARMYYSLLSGLPLEVEPPLAPGARHAHHLYAVRLAPGVDRDGVALQLQAEGIGTSVHFRPIHLHRHHRARFPVAPPSLANATSLASRLLSLPLYPLMQERDVERVAHALRAAVARPGRREHALPALERPAPPEPLEHEPAAPRPHSG